MKHIVEWDLFILDFGRNIIDTLENCFIFQLHYNR